MNYRKLIFLFFLFLATNLFGQKITGEKPKLCINTIENGKYKILSIGNGIELQFYLKIEPKYRTDNNYKTIANEFKEKYCHAKQLRIIYLKSKEQWLILDPFNLEATPLAIFYTGNNTEEKEGLIAYKVVNGKVETRELSIIIQ